MTWILTIAGVVAGLALVVWVIGTRLPGGHIARGTVTLAAPIERVWGLVSDFGATPGWRPDVRAVEMEPSTGGPVRFVETTGQGKTPFEIVSQTPPTGQVVRVVDEGLPFGGTWTWELTPADAGTRITITEDGFIRNPVFRVMGRLFFRPTDTIDRYLRALAAAVGDSAAPTLTLER